MQFLPFLPKKSCYLLCWGTFHEISEGRYNLRKAQHKLLIVRCQVDETANLCDHLKGWPVEDFLDISGVWANVGQELNLAGEKLAFVQIENLNFIEGTKDSFNISFMFFYYLAEDNDVYIAVSLIHSPLESVPFVMPVV